MIIFGCASDCSPPLCTDIESVGIEPCRAGDLIAFDAVPAPEENPTSSLWR